LRLPWGSIHHLFCENQMTHLQESIPLWRQLQSTTEVVRAVHNGASGSAALDEVAAPLRPGVQALAFHAWRNWGRAQALRNRLVTRKPPAFVDTLLCVCLALIWHEDEAPYEVFTLVNQAVEVTKRNPQLKGQAGFLNACLRRFLRERGAMLLETNADPVALWNHPLWWIKRLQREQPDSWQAILAASNQHAPMWLRVNKRKVEPSRYLDVLVKEGIAARGDCVVGIVLEKATSVERLPGFFDGQVSVQDAAAQMAALLLLNGVEPTPEWRILDACAAPGGKTGHLLELSDAEVVAMDIDPQRCQRIVENTQRLGLSAKVMVADAADPDKWWDGKLFEAILLDVPCTASGIVRRHPDVRWLRRESDIEQLAAIQRDILKKIWPLLKPGGRLLYCTCSLFLAEGKTQIETFLARNTDARLLPSPGHLMPGNADKKAIVSDNLSGDHDGFFYALLQKLA
jgi:16S rRNA (cytosine967-C5)-methyltransferase